MKHLKVLGILTAALAAVPATSYAELAYPSKDVNLRAGPAIEYPLVARLQAGAAISVEGCLDDYRWCDVVAGPYRGWVYAGNLVYPYQGDNVPLLTYGAAIGIGVLAFSLGHYWDDHYRARPWYPQRQQWINAPRSGFGPGYRPQPGPGFRPGASPPPPRPGFGPGGNPVPQGAGVRQGGNPTPQAPGFRQGGNPAPQGAGFRQGGNPAPQGAVVRPGGNQPAPQGKGRGDGQRPQRDRPPGG